MNAAKLGWSGTLGVFIIATAVAELPNKRNFDRDRDGKLSLLEFARYQLVARNPNIKVVDENADGTLSDDELKTWARYEWLDAQPSGSTSPVTFEAAANADPKPEPSPWFPSKYLRLRKDHDNLSKELEDADPATISFYRNNLNGDDTWAFEAALGAVLPLYDGADKDPPRVGPYQLTLVQLIPSVTLNRVTGTGGGDLEEVDSLEFRAGLSFELQSAGESFWDFHRVDLNYRNSGALSGGRFKSAGELDWEPVRLRAPVPINGPWTALPFWRESEKAPFRYRFLFGGRLEFGQSPFKAEADTYVKLGPNVGIALSPVAFRRLEVFANYLRLWELNNDSGDFDYFEVGGRVAIDPKEHVSIEGKYRLGEIPTKFTDIDLVQISLAIKF